MSATATPTSLRLLHDRAESLSALIREVRPGPETVDDVRGIVLACLTIPDECRRAIDSVHRRLFDTFAAAKAAGSTVNGTPLMELRLHTEADFDGLISAIETALGFVQAPDLGGRLNGHVPTLQKALEETRSLRSEFSENFIISTPEEMAASRAAIARGEGLELDDAFAEIAGCSKDEWLSRVAAYQRARSA